MLVGVIVYRLGNIIPTTKREYKVRSISQDELLAIKKQIQDKQQQVVNTEIVNQVKENDDAKLLSKANQKVKEEQKAAKVDAYKETSLMKGEQGSNLANNSPKAATKPTQSSSEKAVKSPSKKISLAELGKLSMKSAQEALQEKDMSGGSRGDKDLSQESANNDFLPKVKKDGVQTLLNTREFLYFSYYDRIRKRLDMYWGPTLREQLGQYFRRGRTIASNTQKIAKLLVVMSSDGTITKVEVLENSGIHEIDSSAVDAFNKAGPFPNPPKGIIDSDGNIRIRWDFVLETA